tara:strand:- start:1718 stop:2518 length:801 start_codon:yes stop_codon:yes gene_type:complete
MQNFFQDGFHLVYEPELLRKAINFLQEGFAWDQEKNDRLFRRLSSQNNDMPLAAVFIDKGEIVIGILLFHQGWSSIEKKHIINLSAWYAKDSHRNMNVINFANNLTSALNDKIITNYTPSEVVSKILKRLKYQDMTVKKKTIGFSRNKPFLKIGSFWKFITLIKNEMTPVNFTTEKQKEVVEGDLFFRIDLIKKFSINISILNIYSKKNEIKVPFFWLIWMIIRYKTYRINFYFKDENNLYPNIWLIKNNNFENFIYPSNSELTLK